MNSILTKLVIEGKEENQIDFYKKCNLIVLEIPGIPIKIMGLEKSKVFNRKFKEIMNHVKQTNSSKIKKIYHFDDILNNSIKNSEIIPTISMGEYINSFFPNYGKYFNKIKSEFFRYVVVEFLTEQNDEREYIIDLICEHFSILSNIFKVDINIFNNYRNKDYIDFHATCQGIYSSYKINEKKQSYKKDDFTIDEKIEDVTDKLKIKDFIEYVNNAICKIYSGNNPLHVTKFFLQQELEYKNLREEYIAIKSYLLHSKANQDNIIFLGKETKQWDAKINLSDEQLIIEVTQAIPKNEHMTRQSLSINGHGYKGFSLKLRTLHQEGMDSFPEPIIDAIEKKHKKQYPESRILLVVVLFEFAYYSQLVLHEWLIEIRKKAILGNFKEIWLVVDAEKLYRIY